jgi:DNA repair photolyase
MAPILPGLSDRPEQLAEVVREARAAGARSIWAGVLHLRPGTREHFLEALAADWPKEVERYEQLYAGRAYLPAEVARPITEPVRIATSATPMRRRRRLLKPSSPPPGEQLALAV